MQESQFFNSRKRQGTETGAQRPQLKRQKLIHPTTGLLPSSAFWNDLSKIWLTKSALRELNWRNSQLVPSQALPYSLRSRRPVTRNFLADSKRTHRVTRSASNFLRHCDPELLKDLKRFTRNGGPDLSDLRGVSITRIPPKRT